jgi:hypothetical protein
MGINTLSDGRGPAIKKIINRLQRVDKATPIRSGNYGICVKVYNGGFYALKVNLYTYNISTHIILSNFNLKVQISSSCNDWSGYKNWFIN